MLDIAARPNLGGQPETEAFEAIRAMGLRADVELLTELAEVQHRPAALRTVRAQIGTVDAI